MTNLRIAVGNFESSICNIIITHTQKASLNILTFEFRGNVDINLAVEAITAATRYIANNPGRYIQVGDVRGLKSLAGVRLNGPLREALRGLKSSVEGLIVDVEEGRKGYHVPVFLFIDIADRIWNLGLSHVESEQQLADKIAELASKE